MIDIFVNWIQEFDPYEIKLYASIIVFFGIVIWAHSK